MDKLLRISLGEVGTIRLVCKKCQTVTEIDLERLKHNPVNCPGCNCALRTEMVGTVLRDFANSVQRLQTSEDFDLQLVLPLPDESA